MCNFIFLYICVYNPFPFCSCSGLPHSFPLLVPHCLCLFTRTMLSCPPDVRVEVSPALPRPLSSALLCFRGSVCSARARRKAQRCCSVLVAPSVWFSHPTAADIHSTGALVFGIVAAFVPPNDQSSAVANGGGGCEWHRSLNKKNRIKRGKRIQENPSFLT